MRITNKESLIYLVKLNDASAPQTIARRSSIEPTSRMPKQVVTGQESWPMQCNHTHHVDPSFRCQRERLASVFVGSGSPPRKHYSDARKDCQ